MSRQWLPGSLPRTRKARLRSSSSDAVVDRRLYYFGVVIIIAALLFHQPLLMVTGLLILLIAATTDIWAKYCLQDLDYTRQFSEQRVLFGEEVTH